MERLVTSSLIPTVNCQRRSGEVIESPSHGSERSPCWKTVAAADDLDSGPIHLVESGDNAVGSPRLPGSLVVNGDTLHGAGSA